MPSSADKARTGQAKDKEGSVIALTPPALVTLLIQSNAPMIRPISHGPPILVSRQGDGR